MRDLRTLSEQEEDDNDDNNWSSKFWYMENSVNNCS